MSGAKHLEVFFATWMTLDAAAMGRLYASDATMRDPTLEGARVGRHAIERYYGEMFAQLEQPEHSLLDWAACGERIWFEWSFASGGVRDRRQIFHGVSIQTLRGRVILQDDAFWNPWEPDEATRGQRLAEAPQ